MKKLFAALSAAFILGSAASAYASDDITVKYNGDKLSFTQTPIILNDKTLVQLRPIAEAMELEIGFENGSVILSDENTTVVFKQNSREISVNDEVSSMDVPMMVKNDYTFVPIRDLVEPFGNVIDYDGKTRTVAIVSEKNKDADKTQIKRPSENEDVAGNAAEKNEADEPKVISTGSGKYEFTYFYQSQPDLELEANGRGYCWVCSYAMLFSNVMKTVITPLDVAQYNIDKGYNGNFMAGHAALAKAFGLELVPALSEQSKYFAGFDVKNKGETTLLTESDEDAAAALREALDNFPSGVIVRFEGYPHSMVAVSYDEENIYFNDPGLKNGEHITFENTCLKNFKLSDISYIQAAK